jgi:hypothetical protein
MSALINDDQCSEIKGGDLCERYKNFVVSTGYNLKNVKTSSRFAIDIKRMTGVACRAV